MKTSQYAAGTGRLLELVPVWSFKIKTEITATHIQGQTLLHANEFQKARREEKRENDDDMKDSITDHFILRSIKSTEHEIMQILLSG